MNIDLSFWRFVIIINLAKSLLWGKGGDTHFVLIGTFSNGINTGFRVIILPVRVSFGFASRGSSDAIK